MHRCRTPDILIGLGGGGSGVVHRLLSQDWLLEDVLATDRYPSPPDRLEATTIDISDEQRQHDRASDIEHRIRAAADRLGHAHVDRLSLDGPTVLTESVPDHWLETDTLTDPGAIQELCRDEGLNSWWLTAGRPPLDGLAGDFRDGVRRQRSLAKALYHVAKHGDDDIVPTPTANDDEVAIVTALGGGTGSGIALDLATDIDSDRVHLYAVLPHGESSAAEKMNAHAALSELEYAQLTGETPFWTITLLPHLDDVDDADFEMAAVRTILAHQNKIQGGHGIQDLAPSRHRVPGPPEYAPFTIAVPHTVESPIAASADANRMLGDFLAEKEAELQCEADLYAAVEGYLDEWFPETTDAAPGDALSESVRRDDVAKEVLRLRHRVKQRLRDTLLEDDALPLACPDSGSEELRLTVDEALDAVYDHVDDPESADDAELARQFLRVAPEILDDSLEHADDIQEIDGPLSDLVAVLRMELANIERRRDLLAALSLVSSERTDLTPDEAAQIRTLLLNGALDPDTEYALQVAPNTGHRVHDLETEIEQLQRTRDDLDGFHEEVVTELWHRLDAWRNEVSAEARTLTAINEHRHEALDALDDIEHEIKEAIAELEAAETPDEAAAVRLEFERSTTIDAMLDEMGVPPVELDEIEAVFNEHVRGAKVAYLEHRAGIFGGLLNTGHADEYAHHKANAEYTEWFRIDPDRVDDDEPFRCTFDSETLQSRREAIEESRSETVRRLGDALLDVFSESDGRLQFDRTVGDSTRVAIPTDDGFERAEDRIYTVLDDSEAVDTDTLFSRLVPDDFGDLETEPTTSGPRQEPVRSIVESYLSPIREQSEQVTDRLDRNRATLERLTAATELADDPGAEFAMQYEGRYRIDTNDAFEVGPTDNPYVSRHELSPENLVGNPRDIGDTDILETHSDRIGDEFANVVRRLFNHDERLPVEVFEPHGTGEVDGVEPMYDGIGICPVYMSRGLSYSIEYGSDTSGPINSNVYQQARRQIFFNRRNRYRADSYDVGGPDEISMVLFATGIFLDNISLVSGREGYHRTYHAHKDSHAFIGTHHSLGLDGDWDRWETLGEWTATDERGPDDSYGAYVFRDSVRSVDDGEFIDALLQAEHSDEADARDVFLNLLSCETYESTVSLD